MKKNKKETKYQITCTEDQLKTMSHALDWYSRMFHGQLDLVIRDLYQYHTLVSDKKNSKNRNFPQEYKEIDEHIAGLKRVIFGLDMHTSHGIGANGIINSSKSAYEMHKKLDNCRVWYNHPEGGNTVDFHIPLKVSKDKEMIKVEVIDKK